MGIIKLVRIMLKYIENSIKVVIFLLLSVMIVNLAINVFTRYVFKFPIIWAEELGRYMMVWFAFLGMSIAIRDGDHVKITFIRKLFPRVVQKAVYHLCSIIMLIFMIMVLRKSFSHMSTLEGQISPAMQIPMAVPYLSVPVGMIMMILQIFHRYLYLKEVDDAICSD
ncbi:MAG: hypothetical protein DRP87_10720 [Spirochaetes bacterium]|nr:MAG: hypothetical protein DRP87_10720 [Spirochaetota bacterium]